MSFLHIFNFVLVVLLLVFVCTTVGGDKVKSDQRKAEKEKKATSQADDENKEELVKGKITSFDKFKKMFAEHRAVQLNAIKSLQQFGDNVQRHKLVEIMLQQLFLTLAQARVNVTEWGMLPGDAFPEEEEKQECVSKVYENTAMFGDMVLRLPDIIHPMYDKNREWQLTLAWSVVFCNESLVFEGAGGTLLNLFNVGVIYPACVMVAFPKLFITNKISVEFSKMAQEVNLIPKSPNYVNPFKEVDPKEQKRFKEQVRKEMKKEKKKKKIARGPRMTSHTEL